MEPRFRRSLPWLCFALLAACAPTPVKLDASAHLATSSRPVPDAGPPPAISRAFSPPPPAVEPQKETYTVVVNGVKVQELLFALARDARLNVDIHPALSGTVTLNAVNQTLPQILARIAKQVDMRYQLNSQGLTVMPDLPFLQTYRVDYVNMARETVGSVSTATQIAGPAAGGANDTTVAGNASSTRIDNISRNEFWRTLVQNIRDVLWEDDPGNAALPLGAAQRSTSGAAGAQRGASAAITHEGRSVGVVIANPETGVLGVRATARQHEKIAEFLNLVMNSARRQVLIEATIAEVELSQNYQQGVDWSRINLSGYGFRLVQGAGGNLAAPANSIFEIGYDSKGGNFSGAIKLLESFGNVRVLSTPKVSVLNNQTAVLKVVDNSVYFTLDVTVSRGNQNQADLPVYKTTPHTVPVGLVLNVTPQISAADDVLLNVRPSLSRIVGLAKDPNPELRRQGVINEIPVIRSREIESVLRVSSGNIAIMGGLMEDLLNNADDITPGLGNVPVAGLLFQNRNDSRRKTELVIFLRPTVIKNASLDGDYRGFRARLPDERFFDRLAGPQLPGWQ